MGQESESQRREAQQDQTGRIRHYLDLAQRMLDLDRDTYPQVGAAD